MFKDYNNRDEIFNGPLITPLHTLTTQNIWTRRVMLYYSENGCDYILYISGSNLVQYNLTNDVMNLLPLHNDCTYTSLYLAFSQTGERLVVIGQKLKPPNHTENVKFKFVISPRVSS